MNCPPKFVPPVMLVFKCYNRHHQRVERVLKEADDVFKKQEALHGEAIKGEKSVGQLARSYNVHPISILRWKKEFMEKGPEIFSQKTTIHDYERRIRELERLIGDNTAQKFFNREFRREEKFALVKEHKDTYGLNKVLQVIGLAKSTWYYEQRRKSYEAKYEYLRKPLKGSSNKLDPG